MSKRQAAPYKGVGVMNMNRTGVLLGLGKAMAMGFGVGVGLAVTGGAVQRAQLDAAAFDTVDARQFRVVDDTGMVRASFGYRRAASPQFSDTLLLELADRRGVGIFQILASDRAGSEETYSSISLWAQGRPALTVSADDRGPSIRGRDATGALLWSLPPQK